MPIKYLHETYILDQVIHQIYTSESNIERYNEDMVLDIELRKDELRKQEGKAPRFFLPFNVYKGEVPAAFQRRMVEQNLYPVTVLLLGFTAVLCLAYLLFWPLSDGFLAKIVTAFICLAAGVFTTGIMLALSNYKGVGDDE
ncbi:TPA: hypothetical protein TZW92_001845 [Streptococcus suis]|nr:hypothetical protein [Streptococcus suis]